jgi:predicted RNA polymerase sigma factor
MAIAGLLALMLLNEARRPARTGQDCGLVPLAEQDRSQWDRALIAEGVALVSAALPKGKVGEYQLQAAIAAVHDEAARTEDTDWPQILALYGLLDQMTGKPDGDRHAASAPRHGRRVSWPISSWIVDRPG